MGRAFLNFLPVVNILGRIPMKVEFVKCTGAQYFLLSALYKCHCNVEMQYAWNKLVAPNKHTNSVRFYISRSRDFQRKIENQCANISDFVFQQNPMWFISICKIVAPFIPSTEYHKIIDDDKSTWPMVRHVQRNKTFVIASRDLLFEGNFSTISNYT